MPKKSKARTPKARPPARRVKGTRDRAADSADSAPTSTTAHPDLFDRRNYESEDPWTALYVEAPLPADSYQATARVDIAVRERLEAAVNSPRTPWKTMSDAVRWCIVQGCIRYAEIMGDSRFGEYLALLKAEQVQRAVEAKRAFIDQFVATCRQQLRHLAGRGELIEARRIYERVAHVHDQAPAQDALMRETLLELLMDPELREVRVAAGWEPPRKSRPS